MVWDANSGTICRCSIGGVASADSTSRAREEISSETEARRDDNSKIELKTVLLIEFRRRVTRNVNIHSRQDRTCWGISSAALLLVASIERGACSASLLSSALPLSRGMSKREG